MLHQILAVQITIFSSKLLRKNKNVYDDYDANFSTKKVRNGMVYGN